ncbi:MAG: hypothetical protein K9L98_03460 [Candidatus Pacebacteria bacterium]|nr:hypothetical protein [Candidatus Paceibacterota bacterium]MCF7863036.1 hypothetical protein [Candidatus Paceibacterota bacterium]
MEKPILGIENKEQAGAFLNKYYEKIRNELENIINNKDLLERVSEASYRHPNNFFKIILKNFNNATLRLHVWEKENLPKNDKFSLSDVHDHRWSFVSIPLFGEFRELRFKEIQTDLEGVHNVYKYDFSSKSKEIKGGSESKLIQIGEYIREKGNLYSCDMGEIHYYEASTYPASTIVLTYNTQKKGSFVYKKPSDSIDIEGNDTIENIPLTPEETKKIFKEVLKHL